MADWLIEYGSWCLAPFGLLGMYVVGLKRRWGWVLGMATQSLWAFYAVGTGQYGFLIGTASYFAVYLRNWLRWRTPAVPCPSRSRTGRPCAYELGHTTRHGDPHAGASGINWDDSESGIVCHDEETCPCPNCTRIREGAAA